MTHYLYTARIQNVPKTLKNFPSKWISLIWRHFKTISNYSNPFPFCGYPNWGRRKSILKRSHPSLDGFRILPRKERNCHDGGKGGGEKALIWKNPLIHANKRQQAPVRVEKRRWGTLETNRYSGTASVSKTADSGKVVQNLVAELPTSHQSSA